MLWMEMFKNIMRHGLVNDKLIVMIMENVVAAKIAIIIMQTESTLSSNPGFPPSPLTCHLPRLILPNNFAYH